MSKIIKAFKKTKYLLFSTESGKWVFLLFVFSSIALAWFFDNSQKTDIPNFSIVILSEQLDSPQKADIPWVLIVIGLFSIYFAANYFWQAKGSQFVVNYRIQYFCNPIPSDKSSTKMPYISKIYLRNKKNKFEAIQNIWLQIDKKTIILLANYTDDPLLIEPFQSVTKNLSPLTHYYNEHSACVFNSSSSMIFRTLDRKNFTLSEEPSYITLLNISTNKIIIQTEYGVFPVEANVRINDSDLNNFNTLFPSIDYGKYDTVLSAKIKAVCYFELENKPEDIHDEDTWRSFYLNQELVKVQEKGEELSRKNLEDKFITKGLDQFGLQVVMMQDSGEHSAQYYAVTKDNEKYIINSPVSWWNDFYKKYKNCLQKEKTAISFRRKKSSAPSDDVFLTSLKELLGEERMEMLIRKMSFSYRDIGPEGYCLETFPFRSFSVFCRVLYEFICEKQSTMKIIAYSIRYTYGCGIENSVIMGIHNPEDVVYDVKTFLDDANAFPSPEARKRKREKIFKSFPLKFFSKSTKNAKKTD